MLFPSSEKMDGTSRVVVASRELREGKPGVIYYTNCNFYIHMASRIYTIDGNCISLAI